MTPEHGIIRGCVAVHTPRMGVEATAPDFVRPLLAGVRSLGDEIRALKPDAIVLASTHWVSTFPWYTTVLPVYEGHCVAHEAPELIPGIPYKLRGDPQLAEAIISEWQAIKLPCNRNASPHYEFDYGTIVPLQYIDPGYTIPMVNVPVCVMADLDECFRAGEAIRVAAEKLGKRVVMIASSAFAHAIVRGPETWPPAEHMKADAEFIQMLCDGEIAQAKSVFPSYVKTVHAEMGGRVIATMLGALETSHGQRYMGVTHGPYGQSSASGNQSVSIRRQL